MTLLKLITSTNWTCTIWSVFRNIFLRLSNIFLVNKSWIPITYLKCRGRLGLVWPNLDLMTCDTETRQSARFISPDCANITPTITRHQPHVPTPAPPPASVAWNVRWLLARNLPTERAGWGEVTQACLHQLLLGFMKNLSHVTTLKVLPNVDAGSNSCDHCRELRHTRAAAAWPQWTSWGRSGRRCSGSPWTASPGPGGRRGRRWVEVTRSPHRRQGEVSCALHAVSYLLHAPSCSNNWDTASYPADNTLQHLHSLCPLQRCSCEMLILDASNKLCQHESSPGGMRHWWRRYCLVSSC